MSCSDPSHGLGSSGEPGEPGLPGQPGESGNVGTGGTGGTGGKGGKGGKGGPSPPHLYSVVVAMLAVAFALSVGTLVLLVRVQHNTNHVAELTAQVEKATYRVCFRQMVVRVDLNLNIDADNEHLERFAGRALPIYNCTPDLTGDAATLLTPTQTKVFENFVQTAPNPDSYVYPTGS